MRRRNRSSLMVSRRIESIRSLFFAREKRTNFYAKSLPSDQLIKTVFETKREPRCNRKVGHIGHKELH